ncbi:PF07007 family protein [Caballeronia glebae]|uniref:PF07007 family protein n=1 Tax=Caballeronia glebae TaxID=1777143 RepID=A0A158DSR8_9BURK|nr:lysozyme inhibitor LprI family protein [Caballeronia glebae]SAK97634.1 PF07007 family protein [Caballeronia glebae]
MRKLPVRSFVVKVVALILTTHCSFLFAADSIPLIDGVWRVGEVRINANSTATSHYLPNDPRLVGRLFDFKTSAISNDMPEAQPCAQPSLQPTNISLANTIEQSVAGYGFPSQPAEASDFGFDRDKAQSSPTYLVQCRLAPWHAELGTSAIRGVWLAKIDSASVAMRWYDETLLILKKIAMNDTPKPSFSCRAARNTTEKTICASYELSEFDKSVSAAYALFIKQAKETGQSQKDISADQMRWMKSRNACGSNKICLIESMRSRLEAIVSNTEI